MPQQAVSAAAITPAAASRPAARAADGTKVYRGGAGAVTALDDVSVELPGATFTAIMGPSGSGKSTLMHCLAGLDSVTIGRVGFVFQAFNLLPALSAADNITLPLDIAGRKADRAWLETIIDAVGLAERLDHRPSELSGGQQQRVAVARALATRPEIVFADEPTGNLDSRASAELLDLLRRSVRELGQTVVMVTHDPIAASYAERVVFLADGHLVGELVHPTPERVLDRMKRLGG